MDAYTTNKYDVLSIFENRCFWSEQLGLPSDEPFSARSKASKNAIAPAER
jgi:hypothetical protein